jgi:hypothetical protein
MNFTLSALGEGLRQPLDLRVIGGLDDAIRHARRLLEAHPESECVEIFSNGRFLRELERRAD